MPPKKDLKTSKELIPDGYTGSIRKQGGASNKQKPWPFTMSIMSADILSS